MMIENYRQCYELDLFKNFYVYAYLDPGKPGIYKFGDYFFDYEPFYIGKGIRSRVFQHIKEAKGLQALKGRINYLKLNKIKKIILDTGRDPVIDIVIKDLSNAKAVEIEKSLINLIGRRDLNRGPLVNMTDGGEGGSGLIMSESAKQKLSKQRKGKKLSIEIRKRISDAQFGRKHSEESIKKMREVQKGHIVSEGTRDKLRVCNTGKKLSSEAIKKMSETRLSKNFKHSLASKELMSKNISTYVYTFISPNNEVFDNVYSVSKFCNRLGFSRRTILRHVISGKLYKGWKIQRRKKVNE